MWAKPRRVGNNVYYWHSLSRRTLVQSGVLGLVMGPLMAGLHGDFSPGNVVWCIGCMAAAPLIVDALKPTIVYGGSHGEDE